MASLCPKCGSNTVIAQDIETLSNSVLLVKLEKRIQLCCQQCGWMGFSELVVTKCGRANHCMKPAES